MVRKKGHPAADEQKQQQMAESYLWRRIAGARHARAATADEFHCDEKVIQNAWRRRKTTALDRVF
jgi:hypothetical protein